MDFYLTIVVLAALAADQRAVFAAGEQRYYTVMLHLQAFCKFANAGPVAPRKTAQMQQLLVLQRRQSFLAHGLFAEMQKAPQLIAEIGEYFIVLLLQQWRIGVVHVRCNVFDS